MNDDQRRQWVLNDEGLYDVFIASGQSMTAFLRANRRLIDEVCETVRVGQQPAHFLKYGGQRERGA